MAKKSSKPSSQWDVRFKFENVLPSVQLAKKSCWCRGPGESLYGTGPTCMVGAIMRCWPYKPEKHSDAVRKLYAHLGICNVAEFNDAPGRTHAEVIAAFVAVGL